MEFALTEEQLELQEMVREFVAKEITPYAAEMDRENHAREGLMEKAADMGLLNVVVPEEYGGMGLDSVTVAVIYEELGKGCAGVALLSLQILLRLIRFCLQAPKNRKKLTATF